MTIIEFLTARLDEDEAIARAATAGPWRYNPEKHWRMPDTAWFEEAVFAGPSGAGATCVARTGGSDDRQSMQDGAHIARHDPARVLADIAAKRAIVQTCDDFIEGEPDNAWYDGGRPQDLATQTLRLLASPYSNHPDYNPDWNV